MPRFSLEKKVNAKREIVFDVLSNYENYQKLLPQYFPSIRIRSIRGNTSVVEEHLLLGEHELVIMAKHVTKKPVTHDIFIIGGDAKGSHISQQFIEIPEGTKIIVDAKLNLKGKQRFSFLFGKNNFEKDYGLVLDGFIHVIKN